MSRTPVLAKCLTDRQMMASQQIRPQTTAFLFFSFALAARVQVTGRTPYCRGRAYFSAERRRTSVSYL